MATASWHFRDVVAVTPAGRTVTDVRVVGRRIEAVGQGGGAAAAREVDGRGRLLLLPGLVDDQVHFREPGLTHKADLATESRAAVAGGVTTFLEMPNTVPQTVTAAALEAKYGLAQGRCAANYGFYLGATNSNLAEIERAGETRAVGVKIFMGSSTGDMLVDREEVLERIFARCPLPIATHCEDTPLIQAREAAARARWGDDVPLAEHPAIRSAEACWRSSSLAVALARRHGARLHVLHLTTARELELFDPGPLAGKRITAEACLHHLWFSDEDYGRLGARLKCNPAVKTATDRAALRAAVADGRIDVLATDHAPHTAAEKAGRYFSAPSGLPLVQHSLLGLLDLVAEGALALETVVERACAAPARLFGLLDRGRVAEGALADLVLVDPDGGTDGGADLHSKCGWSPFAGHRFRARVELTLVNGQAAYERGAGFGPPAGEAVSPRREG